jgi:hypothetical protein
MSVDLKYASGSKQTAFSIDAWRSCLNQVCETVRISDSNSASELRSYNGVVSYIGQSACGLFAMHRKALRRDSRVAASTRR